MLTPRTNRARTSSSKASRLRERLERPQPMLLALRVVPHTRPRRTHELLELVLDELARRRGHRVVAPRHQALAELLTKPQQTRPGSATRPPG